MDLHRRRGDGVSHRQARDGQAIPVFRRGEQSVDLAAKGKSRFRPEAEGAGIVVHFLVAQQHAEMHGAAVAGVADDARHRQFLGGMVVRRQTQMAAVVVRLGLAAVKGAVRGNQPFVQRPARGDDLEGRAGFEHVGHRVVAQDIERRLVELVQVKGR